MEEIRMNRYTTFRPLFVLLLLFTAIRYAAADGGPSGYVQVNLVSNSPSVAPALTTDPNLINPWGLAESATSPFWVADQGSGKSTLYNGSGVPVSLIVTVPPLVPPPSGPTGIVFNSTTGFLLNSKPASFIFATLDGTIDAWNSTAGSTAEVEATVPGALFTGLAIGSTASEVAGFRSRADLILPRTLPAPILLYAADFKNAVIDVFNPSFAPFSTPGTFTDPNLPSGYAPYNIQNINGDLYVEYASQGGPMGQPLTGPGLGIVDKFDLNGVFIQRLISPGGAINAPWGITLAPASFGAFGGDLLVGNFGDGKINAFDPTTGAYLGTIANAQGQPLVNNNLWALSFGNGGNGGSPNILYFTAGLNNQTGGLFGSIQPVDSAIQFQVSPTTLVYPGSATASVCITPATNAPATGTVKILDGSLLATLSLQGNSCANWFINPPLNAGTHSLTAVYSGDSNNPAGVSAPVTVTVSPTPTYLQASCGNAGFVYGGNYNCNVNVGSVAGGATGAIIYTFDGGTPVILPLSNGMAQFSLATPNAGSHKVVIGYAQQGNFAASGPNTEGFTVVPATTQVWLSPSNYYPGAGSSLTLTASVSSYSAAAPTGGSVTFYNNGAVIGTFPVNGTGQATLTIPALAAGYYSFNAQFGGLAPDYGGAGSNYLTIQAH
jgi:uncharacterized protein (TIGR03118 family)